MRICLWMTWACMAVMCLAGRNEALDPDLEALVKRVDEVNSGIHSMKAKFTQRKEISLLKDPIEVSGDFFLKKSDGIRFDYDVDEDLVLLITDREMVSLSHANKRADRVKLPRRKTDLTRLLISEQLDTIRSYFEITKVKPGSDAEDGVQELLLLPSKRKLKKRIKEVRIWVNDAFFITGAQMTSRDGDVFELKLTDVEINPDLDPALFDSTVPEGYEVGDRFEFVFGPDTTF